MIGKSNESNIQCQPISVMYHVTFVTDY